MLDFIAFKETMAPKHFELVNQLAQTNEQHIEVSNQIEIQKQKKEELEITRQTSIAIVEDLSKETMKIKQQTEEKKRELEQKTEEMNLKKEKKNEVVEMVSQRNNEVQGKRDEIKAKSALIVYENPLEVENELECLVQTKRQKIKEL